MSDAKPTVTCPLCGSGRIFYQRHDVDWGGQDTERINAEEFYKEGDDQALGDINIYVCVECDHTWQRWSNDPSVELKKNFDGLVEQIKKLEDQVNALLEERRNDMNLALLQFRTTNKVNSDLVAGMDQAKIEMSIMRGVLQECVTAMDNVVDMLYVGGGVDQECKDKFDIARAHARRISNR